MIELTGSPVFLRTGPSGGTPPLFLHGIPTSSDDWTGIQRQTGGLAPDLLGFGRSGKGGQLELTPGTMAEFIAQLLDDQRIDRVQLVAHGWSALPGLLFAQRHPARVERIALFNPLPLTPGLVWPPPARHLRRPVIGELLMGSVTERWLARTLRHGAASPEAWPNERVAGVWQQFDQGTQRAVLRLLRATRDEVLVSASGGMASLAMPALTLWGERDPWFAAADADAVGSLLPRHELVRLPDAGHWPWLDRGEATERLVTFLGSP